MQIANAGSNPGAWQSEDLDRLRKLALAMLVIGLVWRCVRYLMAFPIWGDEALLALNFLHLDYRGLTQRLENCQIAPLLFLWGELTACHWLGTTELSLRLLPFLAAVAGLVLFYRLAREMLEPLASGLAVGFLAAATWPVSMGAFIKPYSLDLLLSVALLLPAVQWLKKPEQTWRLALLMCLAPVALLGSYPAVFIAGAVSLALAFPVYQKGSRVAWVLFVGFNLAILAGFGAAWWVGTHQLNTSNGNVNTATGMENYWGDGFPPTSPGAFLLWFVLINTGQMTGYPIGAADGGSTLTVFLCLIGAWQWAKAGRWPLLVLCVAPFALGLAAALMHRYPYGGAGRLCQHTAPIVCLLAGLGASALIDRPSRSEARRWRWACTAFLLLAAVAAGGIVRDVLWPYHDRSAPWTRNVMDDIRARVPASDWVVVCNREDEVGCLYQWHWSLRGERVSWNYGLDWTPKEDSSDQLWGFYYGECPDQACDRLQASLAERDSSWKLVERLPFTLEPVQRKERREHSELFRFVRQNTAQRALSQE
jgi:hypothetical protein